MQQVAEFGGVELGAQQRDAGFIRHPPQLGKQAHAPGQHDTGHLELVEDLERLQAPGRRQAAQILELVVAEYLHLAEGEDLDEPRQCQPGAMGIAAVDRARQSLGAGQELQPQASSVLVQKTLDRELAHRSSTKRQYPS